MLQLAACVAEPDRTPTRTDPPAVTPSPLVTQTPRATASPSPPPAAAVGGVYLALGDSVTYGIGAPDPERGGYVALLSDRLREADPPITETRLFAVPGETATGFLERRIDAVEDAIEELGERVELVTIGLGANEILRIRRDPACREDRAAPECQRMAETAADEAADALDSVVARVQSALESAGSDATVLLLAYYNPEVEPVATATIVGSDGVVACDPADPDPGLNDRIACVAERRETGLVDLYQAFLGREEELTGIAAGDVHPNAAGHVLIADVIADALGLGPADG